MTNNQLFVSLAGLLVALLGALAGGFKLYLDAKVDPIHADVRMLIDYMMLHEGKIARLEERTKNQ